MSHLQLPLELSPELALLQQPFLAKQPNDILSRLLSMLARLGNLNSASGAILAECRALLDDTYEHISKNHKDHCCMSLHKVLYESIAAEPDFADMVSIAETGHRSNDQFSTPPPSAGLHLYTTPVHQMSHCDADYVDVSPIACDL